MTHPPIAFRCSHPGYNQGAVPFADVAEFARAMVRTADAVGIQVCVDWSIRQCMLAAGWAAGLMPDGCAMAVAKPAAICPLAAAVHHSQLLRPTFWAHAERNDLLHNRRMSTKQMHLRSSLHTAAAVAFLAIACHAELEVHPFESNAFFGTHL